MEKFALVRIQAQEHSNFITEKFEKKKQIKNVSERRKHLVDFPTGFNRNFKQLKPSTCTLNNRNVV